MARVGILAAVLALLFAANASAATRTWDGGCGVDTKWSCAANWSEDIVPEAADTAVFDSSSVTNSTVDEGFAGSIAAIRISSGYTGTIGLARSLVVSSSFSQASGAFTAGSQALALKAVSIAGGSFTASSGTTSIGGALKIAAGATFNAHGGTVSFVGGGAGLKCGGKAFNLVSFAHTSGTKTVGADCSLPLGADPEAGKGGSIALNGTLSGSGTLTTSGILTLGATGGLSGFSGLATNRLTVAGSYDFGEYESLDVDGVFVLKAGGSLTAPSGTASFAGSFTLSPESTFDANEGTVDFDGAGAFRLACGGKAFSLVTFESTGRKTIGSDCTLPLGPGPDLGSGGTILNGTLSGAGTLTQTGPFEVASASPGLDSFADVTDVGSLVLKPTAKFVAPEGALTVNGNFVVKPEATFDANEGTVDLQALPTSQKIVSCNGVTFNRVTISNLATEVVRSDCTLPLGSNPTIGDGGQIVLNGALTGSGALTVDSSSPLVLGTGSLSGFSGLSTGDLSVYGSYDFGSYESFTVSGDFKIVLGATFTAPAGSASFAGDFVNNGTFNANEGVVKLTGTEQALSGSTTFDDLSKVVKASDTLTFAASSTQTIDGALTLEGAGAEALLSLVSSKPGTSWLIASGGSRAVKWVSVADSHNTGTTISAVESEDAGGNTGWTF
jgi:hypothetical protein